MKVHARREVLEEAEADLEYLNKGMIIITKYDY